MSFTLGIVFVLVGLIVSIALHEAGHLIPAKKFNTLVPEYMIGFGKTLWQKKIGETYYGIKLILLGGYCRILGMYGPPRGRSVIYRKGRKKIRAFQAAEIPPEELAELTPTLAQSAREDSLAQLPAGKENRAFYLLPVWKKLLIMFGGPVMNLFLSLLLLVVAMVGIGMNAPSTTLAGVSCYQGEQSALCSEESDWTPSPAAAAGLQAGDKILAWDGHAVSSWEELRAAVSESDEQAEVSVQRGSQTITVQLKNLDGQAGIVSQIQKQRATLGQVLSSSWQLAKGTVAVVLRLPMALWDVGKSLLGQSERDQSGVMSIVGATRIAGEITSAAPGQIDLSSRVAALLMLLSSLNMALFVFNLIPLPPLDGGHIAGALFQGLRSRWAKLRKRPWPGPIDAARAVPVTYAVAAVLIAMTLLLVLADILVPVTIS